MYQKPSKLLAQRLQRLREHLRQENPLLVDVVDRFIVLDKVAYQLGLLGPHQSYANTIPWWPLISVLGTFSAGKSTFVNNYLGVNVQRSGSQAVDDKFTVLCFNAQGEIHTLPGIALDADPRFPFYQISEEIEHVAQGEGERIDTYLQIRTCGSQRLSGRVMIDSPGFDADAQRDSVLRITDHIIDISDLVLVFFDARHPEPGAMRDTLSHLVSGTVTRRDAAKMMFILNQIDATWREDNLEEVVSAWQRAVVQHGAATGRFYCMYNHNAAVEITNPDVKARYQQKSEQDFSEIARRIDTVGIERNYRIIGALEATANRIENEALPAIKQSLRQWARRVLIGDLLLFIPTLGVLLFWVAQMETVPALQLPGVPDTLALPLALTVLVFGLLAVIHFSMRHLIAQTMLRRLQKESNTSLGHLANAFRKNTRFWRSIFRTHPVGWNKATSKRLEGIRIAADQFVQQLNDRYVSPSGSTPATTGKTPAPNQDNA